MEILPPSSTFRDCLNSSPISPSRQLSGIRQLSKIISAVSLARIPSLFSFFPPLNPGTPRSTTKAVALFFILGAPVRATTTLILLLMPWVIQFLEPFRIHSLPSCVAVHCMLAASLPVLASVSPQEPIHSPDASFGSHSLFCCSLPKVRICPVQSELWA